MTMNHTDPTPGAPAQVVADGRAPDPDRVVRAIAKRSFATLATVSSKGWPHVAGVLYELVDGRLYLNTTRTSHKARNIMANPHVAVAVPVRRLPVGPPALVHFQATAELVDIDAPRVHDLLAAGALKSITSHGELDLPDDCFVCITPAERVHTYGIGMPLRTLIRNPLDGSGVTTLGRP